MTSTPLWWPRPIFITSTFRDMQAERDHLRDFVFPVLAERLRERREYLEPIDLRQGVETLTDAEAEVRQLEVLKVCLDEVRRSRPFLVGLLGDRYGWIPPTEHMQAAAEEAGYTDGVEGHSVTELEIAYGVFADHVQRRRSRFYFRGPLPYDAMSPQRAAEYSETHNMSHASAGTQQRLESLKKRIKTSVPDRWREYDATWDANREKVIGLEAWGQQVLDDLWADLETATREAVHKVPDTWQDAERWVLEQFIEDRARGFVGRIALREQLAAFATSPVNDNAPWGLCLTGEAGSGKSAVFARAYRDLEQQHGEDILLLAHAAGTSPRAARINDMLARWAEELATALGTARPFEETANSEEIEQKFRQLLGQASTQKRVIVLIDALDQLESTPRGQHVTWLQKFWPPNARLITTAIPDTQSQTMTQRIGVRGQELGPLTVEEASEVADEIYVHYHRKFNPQARASLLEKRTSTGEPACGNPLWLAMALEALNLLDAEDFHRADQDFAEEPDAQRRLQLLTLSLIERMPSDVDALYGWVVQRAEKLHGEDWVRSFVYLLAIGRSGWREQDFQALIPRLTRAPWDELKFAAMRRTFRSHVVQRGARGEWDFAHQQFRRTVVADLGSASAFKALHASLADHLESLSASDPMHQTETMVHMIGAGATLQAARYYAGDRTDRECDGATRALADHVIANTLNDEQVDRMWVDDLLEQSDLDDEIRGRLCHRVVFDLHDALSNTQLAVRLHLLDCGNRALERLAAKGPGAKHWQNDLSASHNRLGDLLTALGDLSGALAAARASIEILQRLVSQDPSNEDWQHGLAVSNDSLGNVLRARGDLSGALAAYREAHGILERLVTEVPSDARWQRDLAVSHGRLGGVLIDHGDISGALDAYRKGHLILERLVTEVPSDARRQRDVSVSHERLGNVLIDQGDLSGALAAYRESQGVAVRLATQDPGDVSLQSDLAISHKNLGNVLSAQGDRNGALAAYRDSLEIYLRLASQDPGNANWQRTLANCQNHVGGAHRAQGDNTGALVAYRASLEIHQRLAVQDPSNEDWQRGLSVSNDMSGDMLSAQGDTKGALVAYRSSLIIREQLAAQNPDNTDWLRNVSVSHNKVGDVLFAQDDLPGALSAHRAGFEIAERLADQDPGNAGWQLDLSISHQRLGVVLSKQGDQTGALAAQRTSLEIAEHLASQDPSNVGWQHHVWISCSQIAQILETSGDPAADRWWRRAYQILSAIKLRGGELSPQHEGDLTELREKVGA